MQQRLFTRLAIVNRGEPAMRLIAAVRELNASRQHQLRTIALYTEPDEHALFVREADEAFCLGPANVPTASGGRHSSYVDLPILRAALKRTGAEAAWVGWGFVSERADFVDLCDELGVVFIGPPAAVMRKLGDKITAKRIAESADVPVAPWSGGAVDDLSAARASARELGYPLMIKATSGGGGRGIRKVLEDGGLAEAFESARSEAELGFGDPTVFLERMVSGARHVEVQILADEAGTTWALGVRDCSVQRRNQKVLEESPSPALSPEQDAWLRAAAARLGSAAGYVGAGTVEFLYDPTDQSFAFMEVNARLQVEHTVTEECTGTDLVKRQIAIAEGAALPAEPPPSRGHAIEARINAESPANAFAPAPGRIDLMHLPIGPGLRIDSGVAEGDVVAPEFDSMVAKVIAWGGDRDEALGRLRRALYDMALVIRGGDSNKGFLLDLIDRPEIRAGEFDIGWLDRLVEAGEHVPRRYAEVAFIAAAIDVFERQEEVDRAGFHGLAARGVPAIREPVLGRRIALGYGGAQHTAFVRRSGPTSYRLDLDGQTYNFERSAVGEVAMRLGCGGRSWRVLTADQGATLEVEVEGISHRISSDDGGVIRAIAPGIVVTIPVKEGDAVSAGDRIAMVEAMKTETWLYAPFSGRVKEVEVIANTQVAAGTALLRLEPGDGEEVVVPDAWQLDFTSLRGRATSDSATAHLDALRSLMLGYDADPKGLAAAIANQGTLSAGAAPDDADVFAHECSIIDVFADTTALFRRERTVEHEDRPSDAEYLHLFVKDPGAAHDSLPDSFLAALRRAVSHHGIDADLEDGPAMRQALYRLYKARAHLGAWIGAVLAILQRWHERVDVLDAVAGAEFRPRLDRLVAASQGRHSAINDLARDVRYHYIERPLLQEARRGLYDTAKDIVARVGRATSTERTEMLDWLVECPQPLRGFFADRVDQVDGATGAVMLEALTRRYYRQRPFVGSATVRRGEHLFFTASYDYLGRRVLLVSTLLPAEELQPRLRMLADLVNEADPSQDVVLDLFVRQAVRPTPEAAERLGALLNEAGFERQLRRVVFSFSSPQQGLGVGRIGHFTFRQPDGCGFSVDRLYPGLHPMMGKRLDLWRLKNFDLERVPTTEDTYLFHAVAHENSKDQRLIGLAEVRDLTPLRDEAGRIVSLPDLECKLNDALAAIRVFQAGRPDRQRLFWNRLQLLVRPPLHVTSEELQSLAHRIAPSTRGLGLEKVDVNARIPDEDGTLKDVRVEISNPGRQGLTIEIGPPPVQPLQPLSPYSQNVLRCRRRGLVYPYELMRRITPGEGVNSRFPPGRFTEYDLDDSGERLVAVDRAPGLSEANIVCGLIEHFTERHPEGLRRVILLGDPTRSMGSLAEAECRRINAGIALAAELQVPLEWIAVSAGARIAMDTGVENMDWIGLVLRRIVEFTQAGGEINVVVAGINVGAQPYWNAEATMLMHTRGVLIQTAQGAMVLTGKRALDFSGGVSAEDNFGIGGFDHVMGPNGQAQFFATDLNDACLLLLRYYDYSYVVPGERFPRRAATQDPVDRNINASPHDGDGFTTVGEVFSLEHNAARKRPFDVRAVMRATSDQDARPLARWQAMRDASVAVVWDTRVGGLACTMIGLESRPRQRLGFVPADGPETWTAGTLFPQASRKVARAINAASGSRPVVVLANLSGFDGSPDSMRNWQLEYGAEIGRAVVNFDGPMIFCVISRYHGGAFVVFSNRLNDGLEVSALEGSRASVIGGAPAAAVVFARDVNKRTDADPRVVAARAELAEASGSARVRARAKLQTLRREVHSEKLGEVAEEFDGVHSVHRAQEVGSVHHVVDPGGLRRYLVDALERGMARTEALLRDHV